MTLDASPESPLVTTEERPTRSGHVIGIATLNNPKMLNGLSLEMVRELAARLDRWEEDERVVAVVLKGAGEKAFCAGGDLHALYRSMKAPDRSPRDVLGNVYARDFFAEEYRLDYRIHTYSKPIVCWGHGIVMGGGIGLMAGASHRVVTERSRLAMPEISIGLYPDVGGSFLLGRVPLRGGRFLALTGAPLNAADAIFSGLADHVIAEAARPSVFDELTALSWSRDRAENVPLVTRCLRRFARRDGEPGPFQSNLERIADACAHRTLEECASAITELRDVAIDQPWLSKATETLASGAPGSLRIAWELQERTRLLSLADVFRLEYVVSLRCAAHGDFSEGIRALLIDKDHAPKWSPSTLDEASRAWAAPFFEAPWGGERHPLSDLETSVASRPG